MEIELIGVPLSKAKLNLTKFKKLLKYNLNIERAVKNSIIEVEGTIDSDEVIDLIYGGIQWGLMLDVLPEREEVNEINFVVFEFEYRDWTKYKADKTDGKVIKIKEDKGDGRGLIIIQDFITNYGFNIKNHLARHGFTYEGGWNKE